MCKINLFYDSQSNLIILSQKCWTINLFVFQTYEGERKRNQELTNQIDDLRTELENLTKVLEDHNRQCHLSPAPCHTQTPAPCRPQTPVPCTPSLTDSYGFRPILPSEGDTYHCDDQRPLDNYYVTSESPLPMHSPFGVPQVIPPSPITAQSPHLLHPNQGPMYDLSSPSLYHNNTTFDFNQQKLVPTHTVTSEMLDRNSSTALNASFPEERDGNGCLLGSQESFCETHSLSDITSLLDNDRALCLNSDDLNTYFN